MRVNELIEKRKKAFEDAKEFVKTHENENGVLSIRLHMRRWRLR